MKKGYIFKSKDGKEKTIRGADGLHKWEQLKKDGYVAKVHEASFAVTIHTTCETLEDLESLLKS